MKTGLILGFIFGMSPGFVDAPISATWEAVLFRYGPMAVMLMWGAMMAQKFLEKSLVKIDDNFADLFIEVRRLSHRIHGQSRATLAEVASREGISPALKKLAEQMLDNDDKDLPPRRGESRSPK